MKYEVRYAKISFPLGIFRTREEAERKVAYCEKAMRESYGMDAKGQFKIVEVKA